MTHKIIFTALFIAPAEPSRFAYSTVTPWGYKVGLVTPTQPSSSRTISICSSFSFPTAEKRKTKKQI
jgi:hypothetical protein